MRSLVLFVLLALTPTLAAAQDRTIYGDAPPPAPMAPAAPGCPAGGQLMPNHRGVPVCMHQVERHQTNWDVIWSGSSIVGAAWAFEIIFTLAAGAVGASQNSAWSSLYGDDWLTWGVIPFIGPFVQLAFVPPQFDAGVYATLIAEGLIQAGGVAMMVWGILGEDVMRWEPMAGASLELRPTVGTTNGVELAVNF